MKKFLAIAALLASSLVATAAHADDIALGVPGYGGTGCPDGSASVTLSPDQKSLSILFDNYVVEAGGSTNKSFDRKSCNIAIPVHVPQGLSVSVIAIDYRGYNNIPTGGKTTFNVEYFFAGMQGPSFSEDLHRPARQGLYDQEPADRPVDGVVEVRCGREPAHQFVDPRADHEEQGSAGDRRLRRT